MKFGKYIIFEGADGVGKSVLSQKLVSRLGEKATWTCEPYTHSPHSTPQLPICTALRDFCLSSKYDLTLAGRELMLLTSRSVSLNHIVVPNLLRGQTIISDRSFISGMVYAYMEGMSFTSWLNIVEETKLLHLESYVKDIEHRSILQPDLVVLVHSTQYLPKSLSSGDRYDSKDERFFRQLEMTYSESLRCLVNRGFLKQDAILEFTNDMSLSIDENVDKLCTLIENKKHSDPWNDLKQKIAEAEKKTNCIACDSNDDVKVSHQYSGGDLGGQYLIVPLCKMCRIKWFCSSEFRNELVERYPKDLEDISF